MAITLNGTVGITTPSITTAGEFTGDFAIADKILHLGDTNTTIRFPAADTVTIETAGSERLRVNSSGYVGIGTIDPTEKLQIREDNASGLGAALALTNVNTSSLTGNKVGIGFSAYTDVAIDSASYRGATIIAETTAIGNVHDLIFSTSATSAAPTERMRINDTGVAVLGAVASTGGYIETGNDSTATSAVFTSYRAGVGITTGNFVRIRNVGDAAGNATEIIFDTNSAERMRIDTTRVYIGTTDASPAANNVPGMALLTSGQLNANVDATFHRIGRSQDGAIITFYSAGTAQGSLNISGTTFSLVGGHLARWAQLSDNSRSTLLKGTVMSNLDQMSSWVDEDNEQLNCVQISTVEGDKNVAGVFVAWDNSDDGYNDILLAMTGDMVIRIAAGQSVQRGDLLMSAGDGTAKPQEDDIIRSKTVAKVTSIHVSHVYDDGSYCVPCVLMAC